MSIGLKLPDVLLNLAGVGENGVLRAQKASAKKQLVLNDGRIAFAESNQPDEHLAHIMVSMGLLKRPDLGKIVSLMKNGKNSEEAILEVNRSDSEAVRNGMKEQAVVILSSLMEWDAFDMRFFPGRDLIKNRRNMELNIPESLVLSARRAASKRLVPLPDQLLKGMIAAGSDCVEKSRVYPLNEAESFAYLRAQDKIPAPELLPLIPEGDQKPEAVILCLYILGLIEGEAPRTAQPSDTADSAGPDDFLLEMEEMLLRFEKAGLYEILSIEASAGPDAVQAAYHDLARRFHPDRFQAHTSDSVRSKAEQVFGTINKAYRTLRDPELRNKYDATRLSQESALTAAIKSKTTADVDEEAMIEAIFKEGKYSIELGEFEQAVKELNTCVHLRPEKAKYNYYIGLAESEIPRLRKSAEQHLLKSIELESMSIEGRIALARLYIKVNMPRKATVQLVELLRLDPENPEAHKLLDELNLQPS
jgi:tetratricopeptide (TPR) repeat protein